jgi:hypothetical protein
MRDLHLLRALKEGGHKRNPGVKCDSRGAALTLTGHEICACERVLE